MPKTFSVQEVASLNKKIEALNTEGTRVETKITMVTDQLSAGLADYAERYGVTLKGKTLKETAANIKREYESLVGAISKEYDLKTQIVEAIQRGDIDKANELLGITPETTDEEPEESEEPEDVVAQEMTNAATNVPESELPKKPVSVSTVPEEDTYDEDDDYGVDFEEEDIIDEEDIVDEGDADVAGDEVDDDAVIIDDDAFDLEEPEPSRSTGAADFMKAVAQQSTNSGSQQKKPAVKTSSNGVGTGSTRVTKSVSGSSVVATVKSLGDSEDFDIDEDPEDFGFSNALKGSKFVPNKG